MKKTRLALIALLVLSLLVAAFATGCSNQSEPAATEAPTVEATEEPTEEPTEEATEAPTEEATEAPTEAPTEEAAEAPTEEPAEAPAEEATEEPAEASAEEAAPAVAARSVEESAEEATEEPAEEVTEEPAEEATEESTEESTEEATEEPTEEATEEPAEEVTEEPAEEVTEEPAEEATEEPAEEATEEPTEEVTEEPTEEATEEPTEEATEEPAEEDAAAETAAVTEEPAEQPYAGTTLTVYNWYDYIDPAVIDLFEEETGITVEYVNFTTNEEMYTKLEATPGAYDVIFPSDYIIERLVNDGMLAELNYDNMPNAAGLMEWLKTPDYDEGGTHSVAYMWGTVGYLYNTTMVDRELTSWDDMFSEEFVGEVLMMNSVRDTLGVALKSLGYSMNSVERSELEEARDKLIEQKRSGVCAGYLVDEIKDKMVAGEAAIGLVWSGDALYAMEKNEDLAYCVPEEGSNIWVDAMCVPAASQNKEAAECFIDFMCRPDIARMNMDYIYYSTPIQAVVDGMSEEEASNEVLNPPQDVVDRCEFFLDVSDHMDLYEEIWMDVRTAN